MLIELTEENKEVIGDAFVDELVERWSQDKELPYENIGNIKKIRKETGWDLTESLDCYRKMIENHAEDLVEMGYSILGPACLYHCRN